jgi:hypothetical protein
MSEVVPIKAALDPETEARCAERLRVARTHMAAGFYHWIEAGKQFAAIKEDVRGAWTTWCMDHDVARITADALIRVADRFSNALVSNTSSEPLQIDFHAARMLASPSVPQALADEAVERAKAGERITKAEAEKMVAKVRAEVEEQAAQSLVEQRKAILREARAKAAAEIEELQGKVAEDADEKRALRKKLKELDEIVNGKRNPDLEDIERVISRYTGKEIGKEILYNGKGYPPVDPAATHAAEQKIFRGQALSRAVAYFQEAPPVHEMLAETDKWRANTFGQTVPIALAWLTEFNEGLKKHRGS